MTERPHPITSPKGAAVVTFILSVISIFAPFLTGIVSALLFTSIALVVIGWLYLFEVIEVFKGQARASQIALPVCAFALIFFVAAIASYNATRSSVTVKEKPALSSSDLSSILAAIDNRTQKTQEPAPKPIEPMRREETYRIVVEEPKFTEQSQPKPVPHGSDNDIMAEIRKKMNRSRVELAATSACRSKMIHITTGLFGLRVRATNIQNEYAASKNDKKMVAGLAGWLSDVEKFFAENKDGLPDVALVKLARGEERRDTLFGIHDSGTNAWASMDAKRRVIEMIENDVGRKSCEAEGKAAVAQCLDDKKC